MCGIFGAVGFKNITSRSLETLVHRGPDDFGEYRNNDKKVYLGHRRLSIIDLSSDGRQAMKLEGEPIYITYNGEFYNFSEVKRRYFKESKFQSKTDTEVILHLYKNYGYRTPEYIRGMFAFCIYDQGRDELFLCRDRCGIKPLYYYRKHDLFAFSSELSALKELPNIDLELDPVGLDHYFAYGYIPAPFSAYRYIRKLRPAHFLTYDISRKEVVRNQRYWNLWENVNKYSHVTEEDWIEHIDCKIRESTSLHLVSDVPLGVFLSGGLDSSVVVSKVSEVSDTPVKTFTIGFENRKYDERSYAELVSRRFATEHHVEVVNPDAIEILPRLLRSFGEPFSDSSAIPTYYVSQVARKFVTVALSGDGGDEIFAGYNDYKRMHRYVHLDGIPFPIRQFVKGLGKYLPQHVPGYGFLQRQGLSDLELYGEMRCFFSREQKEQLYNEDFRNLVRENENKLFQSIVEENYCSEKELITKLQFIDFNSYLPEDILTKVDRTSMLNSLETRVPLLDHELIELVFACPETIRFKSGNLKYIIKTILSRKLPGEVIWRRKQGFAVPLSGWFRDQLRTLLLSMMEELKHDEFLNYQFIRHLFDLHQKGGRDFSKYLYNIMFYKYWMIDK